MLKSLEGIIIRTTKYGETSLILDIFTQEQGIKSFIIGGVRTKSKKNKVSLVKVLNIVKVEAYLKDNDKLSRIKEISYAYIYQSIPFNVAKASIATLLIEVCKKAVKASDDYGAVYNYIIKGLVHLDNIKEGVAHFHIRFLIGLTDHLGFSMNNNFNEEQPYFNLQDGSFHTDRIDHRYYIDAEASRYLSNYLRKQNFDGTPRKFRREILLHLVDYYRYHIEDFGTLNSLPVLLSLYE